MSVRTDLEGAFEVHAAAIPAMKTVYTKTPEKIEGLPAVTMLRTRHLKEVVDLGAYFDHTWEWQVDVYVSLQPGYQDAQDQLDELVNALIDKVTGDRMLGGLATGAALIDAGRDPRFEKEAGTRYVIKQLLLRAYTYGA